MASWQMECPSLTLDLGFGQWDVSAGDLRRGFKWAWGWVCPPTVHCSIRRPCSGLLLPLQPETQEDTRREDVSLSHSPVPNPDGPQSEAEFDLETNE